MPRGTVLLVDDDEAVRDEASRALRAEGYDVVALPDGLAALSWLAHKTPDLLLTDFVMPRMNGWMLIRALDTKKLARGTPIVVMSSMTDKVGDRLVQMTRVDECIRKPFTDRELLAVVKRHVGRRGGDEAPDTGESDDTWIVMANVQEMLHNAVAEAVAARVDDLVEAGTRTRVLAIVAEMLEDLFDERFAANLLEIARDRPTQD